MFVYRPNRLVATQTYAKRFLRRRAVSYPYLSSDAFANLADCKIESLDDLSDNSFLKNLRAANVVFCKSDILQDFLSSAGSYLRCRVIVSGNSDQEFYDVPQALPRSVRRVYLQNNFITHDARVVTLPIGLENYRLGVNGNPKFIERNRVKNLAEEKILFGPFSFTHSVRQEVFSEFNASKGPWEYVNDWIPPKRFNQLASTFKYVAAVRGNGVDTHRLWEAMYLGNVGLVLSDYWSISLERLRLPIILVNEWTQECVLESIARDVFHLPLNLPQTLWVQYWEREFKNDC
jgi:hypothetical protein